MVTMKEIAELAGVSRGTVDRVLNNRGKTSEEIAENVRRIARELGYERNPAARALSARRERPLVTICIPSVGNPFYADVVKGISTAAARYRIYGMQTELIEVKGYKPEEMLKAIEGLESRAKALLIAPTDDPCMRERINELVEAGVFVVTVNNDVPSSRRHGFVGADFINSGETACALIAVLTGRQASCAMVIGSKKVLGHRERVDGFRKKAEDFAGITLDAVIESEDDDICSYVRTRELLEKQPGITAIFLAAGGAYGACRAAEELPAARRPLVVAMDAVPAVVEMMKAGIVTAIIYQHPQRQGYLAMEMAFEHIVNGREIETSVRIMKNEIRLLENL